MATITTDSIRALACRLDRAILAGSCAVLTTEKLTEALVAALREAPYEVIADLEDAGDGPSCQAWEDASDAIDLDDLRAQAAGFLREWAYAAEHRRAPRLCDDGRLVVSEFRRLGADRSPAALCELAEVIERADRGDADWRADEVCWSLGRVSHDLCGLDAGEWTVDASMGSGWLHLRVEIDTVPALREVLIRGVQWPGSYRSDSGLPATLLKAASARATA